MDGLVVRQVAEQLPLAEAVLRMFDHIAEPEFLNDVFKTHHGRSYEGEISFELFVQLIADALLEHYGSGRQSFSRSIEEGELTASIQAVYGKLRRIPLTLSLGLFCATSTRLQKLYPQTYKSVEIPKSLRRLEVFFHDGKTLKHVCKRLKVLRTRLGKPIGGRLVVTQSLSTGMAVAIGADEDGESGEQPLVPTVLAQTRAAFPGVSRLHVCDRQYCDLIQMNRLCEDGDHFLVRWNRKLGFHVDSKRKLQTGIDRHGRKYTEDWGWVGPENKRRYVRRIHLDRGKEEELILLTDLLDADKYPADDLLEIYRGRWGIEQMFQQVTEVFNLASVIGSTPRATIFQASFCLTLYNMIQVVRAYIAKGQQRPVTTISNELLFDDVVRQLIAWNEVLPRSETVKLLSTTWTPAQLTRRFEQLLHCTWSERWIKSPANTHKTKNKHHGPYPRGGHYSIFRAIRDARPRRR